MHPLCCASDSEDCRTLSRPLVRRSLSEDGSLWRRRKIVASGSESLRLGEKRIISGWKLVRLNLPELSVIELSFFSARSLPEINSMWFSISLLIDQFHILFL